jgi:small subunit ribosomal protein S14
MAKTCSVERNLKRKKLTKRFSAKRGALKLKIADKNISMEERFQAVLDLADLPRNSSKTRIRNRCELTGRPRGYYRKLGICRIELRRLASFGQIPGMTKSSW